MIHAHLLLDREVFREVLAGQSGSLGDQLGTASGWHAAMAGRTEMVVGRWHGRFVHLPMPLVISRRNVVDEAGDLWLSVLETTGQPPRFVTPALV